MDSWQSPQAGLVDVLVPVFEPSVEDVESGDMFPFGDPVRSPGLLTSFLLFGEDTYRHMRTYPVGLLLVAFDEWSCFQPCNPRGHGQVVGVAVRLETVFREGNVYSASTEHQQTVVELVGGQGRRRSVDLRFFRPALYRLSYLTKQPEPRRDLTGGHDGI